MGDGAAAAPPTVSDMVVWRARRTPAAIAMRRRVGDAWDTITFEEWLRDARGVARALVDAGVAPSAHVALLCSNRPEWLVADAGICLAGACTVPVYASSAPAQVTHVLDDARCPVAIVERGLLDAVELDRLTSLRRVFVIDGADHGATEGGVAVESLEAAGARAAAADRSDPSVVDERIRRVSPDDVATIVYTSGTTGPPKGVMLTHRNVMVTLEAGSELLGMREGRERVVCYLPLAHVFERTVSAWGALYIGSETWFARSLETVFDDVRTCKPTLFIGVPRVYEKLRAAVLDGVARHRLRPLLQWGIRCGLERATARQQGTAPSAGLALRHRVADALVLSRLRAMLGMSEVRVAVTGTSPNDPDVILFFHALGIELVEGYGQTEGMSTSCNPPGAVRVGTVGPPLPNVEVRLDDDGEILVRGPGVFAGYLGDEDATRAAMTDDGFYRTGDVGSFDDEGYLRVVDRKKDIVMTAGGKKVAPQQIETVIARHPVVAHALVVGDRRPFFAALVALDAEGARALVGDDRDLHSLQSDERVRAAVQEAVDRANAGLSRPERIKRWAFVPDELTIANGALTPSLKVRRAEVVARYAAIVDDLYERTGAA